MISSIGTNANYVTLSLSGSSANVGVGRYYKCNISADGCTTINSTADRGYKGVGTLTVQWYRSSSDNTSGYAVIAGGITDPYNDTGAPEDGSGRYYLGELSADGATSANTTANRGYRAVVPASTSAPTTGDSGKDIMKYVLPVVMAIAIIAIILLSGWGISLPSLILAIGGIIAYFIIKFVVDNLIH